MLTIATSIMQFNFMVRNRKNGRHHFLIHCITFFETFFKSRIMIFVFNMHNEYSNMNSGPHIGCYLYEN